MLMLAGFMPLTYNEQQVGAPASSAICFDRSAYWTSDPSAQIVAVFSGAASPADCVDIELRGSGAGPPLASLSVQALQTRSSICAWICARCRQARIRSSQRCRPVPP